MFLKRRPILLQVHARLGRVREQNDMAMAELAAEHIAEIRSPSTPTPTP